MEKQFAPEKPFAQSLRNLPLSLKDAQGAYAISIEVSRTTHTIFPSSTLKKKKKKGTRVYCLCDFQHETQIHTGLFLTYFLLGSPEMFRLVIHGCLLLLISLPEILSQPTDVLYGYKKLEVPSEP